MAVRLAVDGPCPALAHTAINTTAEADKATSVTDAAHRLAYIEAVYHVVQGNYLVRVLAASG